jgi:hypothetical protein
MPRLVDIMSIIGVEVPARDKPSGLAGRRS